MLTFLTKVIQAFFNELAKKLAGKAMASDKDVCHGLFRLFVVLEELLNHATDTYARFETYVTDFERLKDDDVYRQDLRSATRELLECLQRFEDRLKTVFVKLKLLDEGELSIRLVQVPEASYTLFKKHFVDDLAPKCIADPASHKYVLRLSHQAKGGTLVNVSRLGQLSMDLGQLNHDGYLTYETVDFEDKRRLAEILKHCSADLVLLQETTDSLRDIIKSNCDLNKML